MSASAPAGSSLHYHTFKTQLGLMLLALEDRSVYFLHFGSSERTLLQTLRENFPQALLMPCAAPHMPTVRQVESLVHQLLTGDSCEARPTLMLKGTLFQKDVWRYLQTIPPGEVRSYSDVARAVGRPQAVRATASACARNSIALLIPCHRVIRGDGSIGGYRWGLHKKTSLLEAEKRGLGQTHPLSTKA